ncbi:Hypothetical predicted protein [Mytilus galloprovincialis]|uniref:Uncharacterized protein n=1 Tax=Mytilus galloprovincialis TaxID=29158 RepID=A0A8B6DCJ7_MYTGA|nr:Hypothetical predicted protein [Mytilus galloprovincialis]
MTQPVQNPNFIQQSPNSPAVGFYTSTPLNINSVMQPMVNPYSDTNCKLEDLTQKVNMIFDKMSTLDELSKKISTFDRTVQNLFKTVEQVSKKVDDVEQGMNFMNEKFEDAKKDWSDSISQFEKRLSANECMIFAYKKSCAKTCAREISEKLIFGMAESLRVEPLKKFSRNL